MPAPVGADGCYRHPMYFACNDFVDDQIGEVVAAAGSNPWIVYTSDHGEMMGAHRMVSKGAAAYDDITRTPLILRPPLAEATPRRSDTPVSHID
ncbi:sulfatase-like hydrolase/transferase, partial [Mycobacterium tuberculosis]|nr:sulfatase-like hydrolase/transferase [Mycobacterium tuberculosis]